MRYASGMDEQDQHDLRLLAILHYVLGGVTAAFALPLLPLVWISIRQFREFEAAAAQPATIETGDVETAGLAAAIFLAASVLALTLCLVHGAVLVYIGHCVARRRRRLLCLVFSGLHVINVPLGTALSI